MPSGCPSCGYMNETYAGKCSKCGTSLAEILSDQRRGLADIRVFSIIYLVTAVIGTAAFIFQYIYTGRYSYGFFSSFQNVTPGQISSMITPYLYAFEIFEGVSAVITLASIFFLRSGYRTLYRTDREFGSPLTGTTLIFVALAVLVIALFALVALILLILPQLSQNPPTPSLSIVGGLVSAAFAAIIALILLLVGTIMGIILGFHKLAVKYEDSYFEGAWILYLVALFFAPAGLIASYMSFSGSNRTMKRLIDIISKEQEA